LLDQIASYYARATKSTTGSPLTLLSRITRRNAYPIFKYAPAAVPLFGAGDEASDLDNDEDGLPLRFDFKLRRLKPLLNSLLVC
jgi:hypothetical protein